MQRRILKLVLAVVVVAPLAAALPISAQQSTVGNEYFQRTWERTDTPVVTGNVSRTWMWGPAYTEESWETYADSPGGRRAVQYFDKSRMEISFPDSDPSSVWYVTNGLLVVEMVTGEMQFGDAAFEEHSPATVNVAGDGDDPTGPTYATFAGLLTPAADRGTELITSQIDRAGNITPFPGAATYDIRLGIYDDVTQHNIAAPFWEFMNSVGMVVEDGSFITGALFQDPFFATGRPISEPYWASVRLAGQPTDVLIQCFERRCLTYTPINAPEWRVEAGNVGLHYHIWRYGPAEHLLAWQRGNEVWAMNATGAALRSLSHGSLPAGGVDSAPVWSPDGTRLAFVRTVDGNPAIYLVDPDGSNLEKLTNGSNNSPFWSPDGSQIAFQNPANGMILVKDVDGPVQRQVATGPGFDTIRGWSTGGELLIERQLAEDQSLGTVIVTVDTESGATVELTSGDTSARMAVWSPGESELAFVSSRAGGPGATETDIWVMNSDGTDARQVTFASGSESYPSWSPDGSMIAYVDNASGTSNIWLVGLADNDDYGITTTGSVDTQPRWSEDGSQIYFVSDREGQRDLYVMDADGSHVRRLTSDQDADVHFSLSAETEATL